MCCTSRRVKLLPRNMRGTWKVNRTFSNHLQPSSATAGVDVLLLIAELQRKHQQEEAELTERFQATQDLLKVPMIFSLNRGF